MTGTSLAEITPERWGMLQRMAQAFATSDMVPEQMKGNIGNCTVALLMAEQLQENPVIIFQSIFFVKGRPGWSTSYMVARANQSGKFIGPLRWRTEGAGEDLAVTCYARLRDAPKDDNLVEVTVSMAIAKADGWTRNDKYRTMPELMLTNRSATWLIRRYCPECLMGYPTSEELDDIGIKDITPKFGIDDFKPSAARKPPGPVIENEPPQSGGADAAADGARDGAGANPAAPAADTNALPEAPPLTGGQDVESLSTAAGGSPATDLVAELDRRLTEAAQKGMRAVDRVWLKLLPHERDLVRGRRQHYYDLVAREG